MVSDPRQTSLCLPHRSRWDPEMGMACQGVQSRLQLNVIGLRKYDGHSVSGGSLRKEARAWKTGQEGSGRTSASRVQRDHSSCTAVMGCTACACHKRSRPLKHQLLCTAVIALWDGTASRHSNDRTKCGVDTLEIAAARLSVPEYLAGEGTAWGRGEGCALNAVDLGKLH